MRTQPRSPDLQASGLPVMTAVYRETTDACKNPTHMPREMSVVLFVLQMRKLRQREMSVS